MISTNPEYRTDNPVRDAYRRGYVAGIKQALDIVGVNGSLTGRDESAIVIALKKMLAIEEGGTNQTLQEQYDTERTQ